jgi:DivIVA domain-containing protein
VPAPAGIRHTPRVIDDRQSKAKGREKAAPPAADEEHGFELKHYVPADLLNVTFPAAVRGYDRRTVDAYVARVNRAIAELKVSASPPAAVRHALDQAGQQVQGLLQSARQTAEKIIASAQLEADQSAARAGAEATELVVNASAENDRLRDEAAATIADANAKAGEILAAARAEAEGIVSAANAEAEERLRRLEQELARLQAAAEGRMREIQSDTEAVWDGRSDLLDDIRRISGGLVDVADAADARLPGWQAVELDVDVEEPDVADDLRAAVHETASTPDA